MNLGFSLSKITLTKVNFFAKYVVLKESLEIAGMIFLYPSETSRLEKMSPKKVLKSLFNRAIMGKYIPVLGQEAEYFHLISKLAQTVASYNWGNTKHLNTVDLKNIESLFK